MNRLGLRRMLALAGVALAALVLADVLRGDPYPLNGPAAGGQRSAAAVGQAVPAVVLYIEVRPGDRIELLGAEAVGLVEGATVEFFFSPPVSGTDGSQTIGKKLEPLAGAVAQPVSASPGPHNSVGIVARMTALRPGRFVLTGLRLRYRLNGGREQTREGIDVVFTVCADDPAPTACPPPGEGEDG